MISMKSSGRTLPKGMNFADVLVVDDDPADLMLICEVLSRINSPQINIHSANGPEKALEILEKESIDVCISDVHLGAGLDATQLIDSVRHHGYRVAFVAITGKTEEDSLARELLLAGYDDVLVKKDLLKANLYRIVRNSWLRNIRAKQVEHLALIDPLTRVMNRRSLEARLTLECDRTERTGLPLAVIFLDLDEFKQLNDVHGHLIGDIALNHVGQLLKNNVRKTDAVGRYGGDEFVVVMPACGEAVARFLAIKLRDKIVNNPLVIDGKQISLDASVGTSCYDRDSGAVTAKALMDHADQVMFEDKRRRKAERLVQSTG